MNKLIQMSQNWHFSSRANAYSPFPKLPQSVVIKSEDINTKLEQLKNVQKFWQGKQNILQGALISAYYDTVIPKTHRLQQIFCPSTTKTPNDFIVGIRYLNEKNNQLKHVITYYIDSQNLSKTISNLKENIKVMDENFNGKINNEDLNKIEKSQLKIFKNKAAGKRFAQSIVDLYYLKKFDIYNEKIDSNEQKIVSFYNLEKLIGKDIGNSESIINILQKIGINKTSSEILDKNVVLLDTKELEVLKTKGSFLVYSQSTDLFDLRGRLDTNINQEKYTPLPHPTNEPIIGVIDTVYRESEYFSEWVEYDNDFEKTVDNKEHGNEVTSIIVDGPKYNPEFQDNCGLFRVHHFGVSRSGRESSFRIIKRIKEIVENHPEIHVWNLSLGSPYSTNTNRISNEAAVLDQLQNEHSNILFVVAGTNLNDNKAKNDKKYNRIGSPADSVNSLVVNSVDSNGKATDYARKGPVLHYFVKPDICYYGGDANKPLLAATSLGQMPVIGTSFAAPWIARKASFLIDKMHLSREVAKALIIDSASGWLNKKVDSKYMGYGVVPTKIEDVINCKSDEIRFFIDGMSRKSVTYSDGIPVPANSLNKFPFVARATLVYFPSCSSNQGVDYTDTELSLQFGRIKGDISTSIKSIVNDNNIEKEYLPEKDLRRILGKWENVKVKTEKFTPRRKGKDVLGKGYWGLKLVSSERLSGYKERSFHFGVVVTLKNIEGKNLNEKFKQLCRYNNWRITDVDIHQRLQANIEGNQEIDWTDD